MTLRVHKSHSLIARFFSLLGMLAVIGCMFYVEFDIAKFITIFLFRVHDGKLGQVANFRPTLMGGNAKHCIDQYMVLFHYCSPWGDTAMPGGLHARLCHAFLVELYLCTI